MYSWQNDGLWRHSGWRNVCDHCRIVAIENETKVLNYLLYVLAIIHYNIAAVHLCHCFDTIQHFDTREFLQDAI